MSTQALTIRIGADANGAISVISQTTAAVNNLNQTATRSNSGVASLTGGVQNLGRWSGQTTSAMASLTGGVSGLSRATLDAVNGTTRLNQQLAENTRITNAAAGSFSSFKSIIGGLGLGLLANSILKVNMEMQALRTSLETVTGSANNVRIAFEGIQQFAAKTPYSVKEIADAFIVMKNRGLAPTEAALTSFGNTASAMGKSLDQMIQMVADATSGSFERLAEFGMKSNVEGNKVKFTFKGIETTVKNSSEEIEKYLTKIGNVDFAGGMDKMSATIKGALSNLGAAWDDFQDHLLNSNKENAIAQWMTTAANSIGKFDVWLNGASTTVGKIQELQKEQNELVSSIRRYENEGSLHKMYDDARGFDVNLQKNRLEQNIKEIESLKALRIEEEKTKKTIESSTGIKGITPEIKALIENAAQKRNVDANLIQAIIEKETGGKFNQNALSDKGAAGLMQIMPVTAEQFKTSFDKVKSDAETNIDVGTQAILRALKQSKGDITEALARYNWGEGNVKNSIDKNHGVFDINKAPPETRDYVASILKKYKSDGGSDKDNGLVEFYKESDKAAQKSVHEHEQAAKKIADNDRQLTESTAFGKYNATIDELTESFKRGGISQATYSQGIENANETLLKNTDYVQANIKVLDEQAKQYAKNVGHVNDYNATIDELARNKQRGAISQGEYGMGIAQANASLMNQVTDKQITPKNVGEVIDAQNALDSEKALTKLNEQASKTIDSFNQLGDSGKMAFDGILGGISAVASAASNFGDVMTKLNDSHADYAKSYDAFMKDSTRSEADKAKAKIEFEKENAAYQNKSFQAEISGARSLAGATAKLFSEKSAARKAFHGIEMGLAVIEMAMSAKKMIVDVAAGAANMFAQSGWGGFAGVAAMAAVMGGLGFAMAGSGAKVTDLTTPETSTTGSVLGSNEASNSIKNVVDTLNSIHASEYMELKSLNENFKNLVEMTTKGTALALRDMGGVKFSTKGMNGSIPTAQSKNPNGSVGMQAAGLAGSVASGAIGAATGITGGAMAGAIGGSIITGGAGGMAASFAGNSVVGQAIGGAVLGLAGGVIFAALQYGLGKLLGIGKVKFEAVGGGIITNAQKFVLDGMEQEVQVLDYSKVKRTVKGWFSDDVTYFDVINGMNNPLTKLFTGVFAQVEGSILEASKVLNVESLINKDITLAKMKLSLKKGDKYTEENQKKIEDAINKATDDIASQALGRYFSAFQKLGEGMAETTSRLASQGVVAKSGFEKLGMTVKLSGLGLVSFSDSLANAMGGLKEMQSAFDDIYNSFTSDSQKLIDAKKATQAFLDSLKIPAEKGIPKTITTDADALKVVDYLKGSLESVSTVLGGFKSATNAKPENDITKTLKDFAGYFSGATKNTLLGLGKNITTESLKAALVGSGKSLAGEVEGTKAINVKMWQGLLDYAKANSDFKSSQTQFDKARWESPELEKLVNDLGFALPDTIDGVQKFVAGLEVVNDSISKNINQFSSLTKTIKLVTSEQEKMIETLKKSISGFKDSIEKWVLNKQITQLGTPETQFKLAQDDFNKTLGILRDSSSTPEQLTQAMSDITGSADAYISKIEQMYAHGETGANLIEGVVNSVKNLPKTVSLQQQTVNLLTDIKSGIFKLPEELKGTVLGGAIMDSYGSLQTIQARTDLPNDLKNSVVNTLSLGINDALKLGLSSFNQSIKDSGADVLKNLTGSTIEIMASLKIPDDKKVTLINGLSASLNSYSVLIDSKIKDPSAELDAIMISYFNKSQSSFDAIFNALSLEGTATGKFIYTSIAGSILDISKIEIPAFNVNGALTSINSITAAAQAALAALQTIGAQSTAITTPLPKTNLPENLIGNSTSTFRDFAYGSSWLEGEATNYGKGFSGDFTDTQGMLMSLGLGSMNEFDAYMDKKLGYTSNYEKFAKGGISNVPAIFGEAGAEAAVPLPDGRSIPVTLNRPAANDSNVDTTELVAELKENNKNQATQIRLLTALLEISQASLKESKEQTDVAQTTAAKIRIGARQ
ncbi:MAG: transglycosylase SLT domain-containing protein [Methylococcaceae bacterium]